MNIFSQTISCLKNTNLYSHLNFCKEASIYEALHVRIVNYKKKKKQGEFFDTVWLETSRSFVHWDATIEASFKKSNFFCKQKKKKQNDDLQLWKKISIFFNIEWFCKSGPFFLAFFVISGENVFFSSLFFPAEGAFFFDLNIPPLPWNVPRPLVKGFPFEKILLRMYPAHQSVRMLYLLLIEVFLAIDKCLQTQLQFVLGNVCRHC